MSRHEMTTASMITCAGCKHIFADSALFCPNCGTPKARDAASGDPLVGKILGERFQVLDLIGQGGSGTIYRAEHVTLRRKVAIKVLHNELSRDDLAVERFRREATTVAEIDNEHIVEIHDFGRTPDGRLYLAMELLEGETLDAVLAREKTLSVERTADILIQVGEALMEAHAIGYVHRDLRPRNLYLAVRRGKANFVKLLDFGLAKLVESDHQAASTSLGMTFGDPRYMSPEQARGDRIDRRADIYQLGCIAYEVLTGAPPFTGNRVFDILSKQVTEIPAPLPTRRPGVPLWMEAAVAKMLAKDPENRFATTTRLVEALRRGLETGEVMEDEIARRRESIPPPSVSRVMQKMGISGPVDSPVQPPVQAPASAPIATSTPLPTSTPLSAKHTIKGHIEGPMPSLGGQAPMTEPSLAAGAAAAPAIEAPRRRTGTPQVGVPYPDSGPAAVPAGYGPPAMPAPLVHGQPPPVSLEGQAAPMVGYAPAAPHAQVAPQAPLASQAPVTGVIEPRMLAPRVDVETDEPRTKAPTGPVDVAPAGRRQPAQGPGDSAAWFEDGERASEAADAVRSRKLISPSTTDLSFYDESVVRPRRWPLALGALLLLGVVGGGIALALSGGKDKPAKSAEVATQTPPAPAPPMPSDVPPSQIITPGTPAAATTPAVDTAQTPTKDKASAAKATTKAPSAATTKSTTPSKSKASAAKSASNDDDTASRRPGGDWFPSTSGTTTPAPTTSPPATPAATTAPPATTPVPTGVSGVGGPQDPYGGGESTPAGEPEKKAEFFAHVGDQQLASGDTAGAAASFKKALELDPKHVPAVIGMGEIALRQGLFGDAIAHLKKASRLAPRSSRVFTLLGEAYLNSGNNSVAVENFKKALQIDPDNARAREGFNEASARVPPPEDDEN